MVLFHCFKFLFQILRNKWQNDNLRKFWTLAFFTVNYTFLFKKKYLVKMAVIMQMFSTKNLAPKLLADFDRISSFTFLYTTKYL